LPGQSIVSGGDIGQGERWRRHRAGLQDFLSASSQVAVVPEGRGEFVRTLFRDLGDGTEKERETDREDALFALRKDAAAKEESGDGRFRERRALQKVCDQANLLGFL
jgi:hypothetical protein